MTKIEQNRQYYKKCSLCPRKCGVDRTSGSKGVCQMTDQLVVARAALHYWEEPCISGNNGSGAVFFSGCNMHCVFCQNEEISWGKTGKAIDEKRLAEIYLELEAQGANNINLVTATHYIPHAVSSILIAKEQGLKLPVIYNCSGYESVDSLRMLEGIVDVYLPDFKYMSPELSGAYSHAKDYAKVTKAAIAEMVRQQPQTVFYPEDKLVYLKDKAESRDSGQEMRKKYGQNSSEEPEKKTGREAGHLLRKSSNRLSLEAKEGYLIKKGVIVRQLLLPQSLEDAKEIVSYLYETYGDKIYISMMSQYTPMGQIMKNEKYREILGKPVEKEDYENYLNFALDLGVTKGFFQDGQVAKESFIPHFDSTGV